MLSCDEWLQVEAMLQLSEKLRHAYVPKEKFKDFTRSSDLTEARKRLLNGTSCWDLGHSAINNML
jgi:hypothetical protein